MAHSGKENDAVANVVEWPIRPADEMYNGKLWRREEARLFLNGELALQASGVRAARPPPSQAAGLRSG
jgi:hypothetical protein